MRARAKHDVRTHPRPGRRRQGAVQVEESRLFKGTGDVDDDAGGGSSTSAPDGGLERADAARAAVVRFGSHPVAGEVRLARRPGKNRRPRPRAQGSETVKTEAAAGGTGDAGLRARRAGARRVGDVRQTHEAGTRHLEAHEALPQRPAVVGGPDEARARRLRPGARASRAVQTPEVLDEGGARVGVLRQDLESGALARFEAQTARNERRPRDGRDGRVVPQAGRRSRGHRGPAAVVRPDAQEPLFERGPRVDVRRRREGGALALGGRRGRARHRGRRRLDL
mmetsp:Transcript_24009/g.72158  ORF Transcript_24009/g.72158 Transcript_24009/m.72158 type:complete len:281 (-) Transcript_24009:2127-2969(-)